LRECRRRNDTYQKITAYCWLPRGTRQQGTACCIESVKHENIVACYSLFEHRCLQFAALEFCDSGDLAAHLQSQHDCLPATDVSMFKQQMLSALFSTRLYEIWPTKAFQYVSFSNSMMTTMPRVRFQKAPPTSESAWLSTCMIGPSI
jgi:hypothetical protein